jgi:hypothetical protein
MKCKRSQNKNVKKTTQNINMSELLDTDKGRGLLHDRALLSTGRTSSDKQNRNCLDYNQNLVMSPGGVRRQDGRTD